jgi:hypothetical protein
VFKNLLGEFFKIVKYYGSSEHRIWKGDQDMTLIDDLGRKLKEVVKTAGEKTDELIETGKIKYDIYKEDEAIRRLLSEIGKTVYVDFQKEVNHSQELDSLCRQIASHQESIRLLKEKEEEVRIRGQKQETRRVDEDLPKHEGQADSQIRKEDES